jgi:predicted  nucleic acid-binding Zn-ribbon protein
MDPVDILAPLTLLSIVGIVAAAFVKVARLRATRVESLPPDVGARLEELERSVQGLQQELVEAQERLDFAERLLSKARSEGR